MCTMFDTPGRSFAAFVGLDESYPGLSTLIEHLDEAFFSAGEDVIRAFRDEDPTLRAMLHPRYLLWEHVPVAVEDVREGMWLTGSAAHHSGFGTVRVEGQVCRITEHWVSVRDGETTRSIPTKDWDQVRAVVPIPLDAATLVDDETT